MCVYVYYKYSVYVHVSRLYIHLSIRNVGMLIFVVMVLGRHLFFTGPFLGPLRQAEPALVPRCPLRVDLRAPWPRGASGSFEVPDFEGPTWYAAPGPQSTQSWLHRACLQGAKEELSSWLCACASYLAYLDSSGCRQDSSWQPERLALPGSQVPKMIALILFILG